MTVSSAVSAGLLGPHHDGAALLCPVDAPVLGDTAPVFVRVPRDDGATSVWLRTVSDAEPRFVEGKVDRETEHETWWRCDLPIRNPVTSYRFLLGSTTPGRPGYRWLNGEGAHPWDVTDAADFRLSASPAPPAWARDSIVYQVFPDRFARSARADGRALPPWAVPAAWGDPVVHQGPHTPLQVYGGDLDGIAERLDHVASLGVDTVYLTPVFPAESNHRYNASSFDEVDPLLGGEAALARLADAVHARGWRLLGDLTTNHCGDTHPWFRRALADPTAPEREWFYFTDGAASPPGPAADGADYESWLGFASLPKFRHSSDALRRRLVAGPDSVAARWLAAPTSLDGWRVDVANMTGRHRAEDHNRDVARDLRATIGADHLLLAEHCHDASADLAGDGWHGAMNYAGFTRPLWSWLRHPDTPAAGLVGDGPAAGSVLTGDGDYAFLGLPGPKPRLGAESFVRTARAFTAAAPWRQVVTSWSMLGSHDTARIRTVLRSADVVAVAAGLLFTMPGTPMLFAGDEIGQRGTNGEDARRPFPWSDEAAWDRRTLADVRALAALRRARPALRHGGLRWVHGDGEALVFLRETADDRLLVLAARGSHEPVRLSASALALTGEAPNVHGGATALRPDASSVVTLPGDGPTFQVWQLA